MIIKQKDFTTPIKNESGASALAMAMFFTLLLGYFSVLALGAVQDLISSQKLSDAQQAKTMLKAELTLLLSDSIACQKALQFQSSTSSSFMAGSLSSLNFPNSPNGAFVPYITTNNGSGSTYDNLNITDLSVAPIKAINTAAGHSFLSSLNVSFTAPGSSRVLTASLPIYFTVDQTQLALGVPLTQIIKSCFATQAASAICNTSGCTTFHDQTACTNITSSTGAGSQVYDPLTDNCGILL